MNKQQCEQRADSIREYLKAVGVELSSTQAHEVLARAHGHKNKHVLADVVKSSGAPMTDVASSFDKLPSGYLLGSKTRVLRADDGPLTWKQFLADGLEVDVVLPVLLEEMVEAGTQEAMNAVLSKRITGHAKLLRILFREQCPSMFGDQVLTVRVRGELDLDGEVGLPQDAVAILRAASDRQKLATDILLNRLVDVRNSDGERADKLITRVDNSLLDLMVNAELLFDEAGNLSDAWNELSNQNVFWADSLSDADSSNRRVTLKDLFYAKFDPVLKKWNIDYEEEGNDSQLLPYRFHLRFHN